VEPQHKLFQVGQKALIERDGSVLVLFFPNGWLDLPGGRIDEGETDLIAALKREVTEETTLEIAVGEPFATGISRGGAVYLVFYRCRYVSGEVVLSHEHSDFRWVDRTNYHEVDDGTVPLAIDVLRGYFDEETQPSRIVPGDGAA
jgi:8-oxo-dGTP diphosphatase